MSEANLGNQHWLGKTHTDETKAKISAAHKGRVHGEEQRGNMSVAHLGNRPTAASSAKRSETTKATMATTEVKEKMRAGQRRRRQRELAQKADLVAAAD